MVNKSLNEVLVSSLKNDRMITICFQGKPFNIHSNPCLCFNTDAKEVEHSLKTYIFWNEHLKKKMSFSSKEIRMQK